MSKKLTVLDHLILETKAFLEGLSEEAKDLEAENARLRDALKNIWELPCCDKATFPNCRVCAAIDVYVHAGLAFHALKGKE